MKICIVATGYPRWKGDFDSTYLHQLSKNLVKLGVEVHVIAPHAKNAHVEEIIDGVHIHRFRYMYPDKFETLAYFPGIPENIKKRFSKLQVLPFVISMTINLFKLTKKHKFDIINPHWIIPSGWITTGTIFKTPIITTIYGADLTLPINKYPFLKVFLEKSLLKSDGIISISTFTKKYALNNFLEISEESIKVVPYGVDDKYFIPPSLKNTENKFDTNYTIMTCGRLVERKGIKYLIESMVEVLKKFPKTKLIIVGDGPEKNNLVEYSKKLGILENIEFLGAVHEEILPKWYKSCDLFVLPSIVDSSGDTEGLGLVLVEAMASAKPVIGTNVGGIPDIISKNSDYGYLIDQKNPKELSVKIIEILSNDIKRIEMGTNAYYTAKNKFSWENVAKEYVNIFQNISEDSLKK
ncbi:glycosyltransferase family 4 protein [Methanococcus maripaludis]|uniref:glycosyltransferase family 4 protein n=1 Tax=Methanococcus maripaludis TaxID=39152 RepID=UPI003141E72C